MKNIVLIGFMGTGKTLTGRLLAGRLGRSFVDVDRKIESECGMTVAEYFAQAGEAGFRRKEEEVIARVARYHNAVIATGGGVVLNPENMKRLRSKGIIVSLAASLETILERTGRRNTRPLLNRPDRAEVVARLLDERSRLYSEADLVVDTSEHSPHQVVEIIVQYLRREGYLRG